MTKKNNDKKKQQKLENFIGKLKNDRHIKNCQRKITNIKDQVIYIDMWQFITSLPLWVWVSYVASISLLVVFYIHKKQNILGNIVNDIDSTLIVAVVVGLHSICILIIVAILIYVAEITTRKQDRVFAEDSSSINNSFFVRDLQLKPLFLIFGISFLVSIVSLFFWGQNKPLVIILQSGTGVLTFLFCVVTALKIIRFARTPFAYIQQLNKKYLNKKYYQNFLQKNIQYKFYSMDFFIDEQEYTGAQFFHTEPILYQRDQRVYIQSIDYDYLKKQYEKIALKIKESLTQYKDKNMGLCFFRLIYKTDRLSINSEDGIYNLQKGTEIYSIHFYKSKPLKESDQERLLQVIKGILNEAKIESINNKALKTKKAEQGFDIVLILDRINKISDELLQKVKNKEMKQIEHLLFDSSFLENSIYSYIQHFESFRLESLIAYKYYSFFETFAHHIPKALINEKCNKDSFDTVNALYVALLRMAIKRGDVYIMEILLQGLFKIVSLNSEMYDKEENSKSQYEVDINGEFDTESTDCPDLKVYIDYRVFGYLGEGGWDWEDSPPVYVSIRDKVGAKADMTIWGIFSFLFYYFEIFKIMIMHWFWADHKEEAIRLLFAFNKQQLLHYNIDERKNLFILILISDLYVKEFSQGVFCERHQSYFYNEKQFETIVQRIRDIFVEKIVGFHKIGYPNKKTIKASWILQKIIKIYYHDRIRGLGRFGLHFYNPPETVQFIMENKGIMRHTSDPFSDPYSNRNDEYYIDGAMRLFLDVLIIKNKKNLSQNVSYIYDNRWLRYHKSSNSLGEEVEEIVLELDINGFLTERLKKWVEYFLELIFEDGHKKAKGQFTQNVQDTLESVGEESKEVEKFFRDLLKEYRKKYPKTKKK